MTAWHLLRKYQITLTVFKAKGTKSFRKPLYFLNDTTNEYFFIYDEYVSYYFRIPTLSRNFLDSVSTSLQCYTISIIFLKSLYRRPHVARKLMVINSAKLFPQNKYH